MNTEEIAVSNSKTDTNIHTAVISVQYFIQTTDAALLRKWSMNDGNTLSNARFMHIKIAPAAKA